MFTDLHGHYAWHIDDGIRDIKEAKQALEKAKNQNISTIVATPHVKCGDNDNLNDKLRRIEDLRKLALNYHINIIDGCELMLNRHTRDAMENKKYMTIGHTDYILCEYDVRKPTDAFLEYFDTYVNIVLSYGMTPVVAHVERYFHEEIDLDYVRYLIDIGCVIQVNTTNILGGSSAHHDNAMKLLDKQLVHVIASDSHRAEGARSPNMQECYDFLYRKHYPKEYIQLMMEGNPNRIIKDMKIITPKFKKSLLKSIFS